MAIFFLAVVYLLAQGQTKFLGPVLFFCLPVIVPAVLATIPFTLGGTKK
jgi:hypothetical protein